MPLPPTTGRSTQLPESQRAAQPPVELATQLAMHTVPWTASVQLSFQPRLSGLRSGRPGHCFTAVAMQQQQRKVDKLAVRLVCKAAIASWYFSGTKGVSAAAVLKWHWRTPQCSGSRHGIVQWPVLAHKVPTDPQPLSWMFTWCACV